MMKIARAKELCSYLERMHGSIGTVPLLEAIKCPVNERRKSRRLLKELARLGVLEIVGGGKFRWKLLDRDYNRDNPFNRKGKTVPEPKKEPEPPKIEQIKLDSSEFDDLHRKIKVLEGSVSTLEDEIVRLKRVQKVEIVVKHFDDEVKVNGRVHPIFKQVMFHVNCGDNVMLVGPKGCGKTVLAGQVATALKREHGFLSLSGGVTESKLFGRVVPNVNTGRNEYHSTQFVDLFENGGVFLLSTLRRSSEQKGIAQKGSSCTSHGHQSGIWKKAPTKEATRAL